MFEGTKIKEKVKIEEYLKLINNYKESQIECTDHTFFRLSQKQRAIFTCSELKRILIQDKPFLVGTQFNKNYATFYRRENKTFKIILRIDNRKINIVTFYFIEEWQIPKI